MKVTRFVVDVTVGTLLIATLAFEPGSAVAQAPDPAGGGGSNLQQRVEILETSLALETAERQDADNREAVDRVAGDTELKSLLAKEGLARAALEARLQKQLSQEAADRVAGDAELKSLLAKEGQARKKLEQGLQQRISQEVATLTDVLCQAVQRMAGNPSAEAIALCGDRLFKTVFITSSLQPADLKTAGAGATGLEGADNICNLRAQEAVPPLPGTYTAWISDSAVNARDRITQSAIPYRRTDGAKVADNFADLLDCTNPDCLQGPILFDENGDLQLSRVWTGTGSDGLRDFFLPLLQADCAGWTSSANINSTSVGQGSLITSGWTDAAVGNCLSVGHLYCFQN